MRREGERHRHTQREREREGAAGGDTQSFSSKEREEDEHEGAAESLKTNTQTGKTSYFIVFWYILYTFVHLWKFSFNVFISLLLFLSCLTSSL